MPTFNNKSSSSSSKTNKNNINNNNNNMSASMIEQTSTFSMSKRKRRPCYSIYTDVIIPACPNNKDATSPILPSGHLETSTRFWQFKVEEGLITYVRYGNIRADGSLKERATHIQQHSCYGDARKFVENLIDEKIKAGYVGWTRW